MHPTRDDPVVAALSPVVGGPMGAHGARHRWWHPLRVLLALTTVTLALGMLHQVPCERDAWASERAQHAQLCASGIAESYVEDGLAELAWPLADDEATQRRFGDSTLAPVTAAWAWGAARLTHALSGDPDDIDTGARSQRPLDELAERDDVRREVRLFVGINAVGLAALALLATALLVGAASRRGRPWDAAAWAASPLLALTWLTGWAMLTAALLAVALAAWVAGRRPVALVASVVALGALVPWRGFLDPGLGSVWLVVEQATGASFAPGRVLLVSGLLLAAWVAVVLVVLVRARRAGRAGSAGRAQSRPGVAGRAQSRPGPSWVARAVVLVSVGALAVSPQAPPAWSLVLLPAVALAVPHWRDLLVWQVGELVALLLTGLYLGDFLAPTGGGPAAAYWVAVAIRLAAQAWLVTAILADLRPADAVCPARPSPSPTSL